MSKEKQCLKYGTSGSYWITPPTFIKGLRCKINTVFSKWDIIGNVSAKNEDFCYGAGKGPYGHSPLPLSLLQFCYYITKISY